MRVNRGDFTPDPIILKRNLGPETVQSGQAARKSDASPAVQQPDHVLAKLQRQDVRLILGALARAQSALAGLEEFRSVLMRSGAETAERSALDILERSRYQGEAVLEPHRRALLRAAANRETAELDRLIGTVRQNILSLAGDRDEGSGYSASRAVAALAEGIRRNGQALERLERNTVSRLLS